MNQDFDYIIVGAGTAGCALDRLLSEAGLKVLILEAGTNNSKDAEIINPSLVESLSLTANPE